MSDRRHPGRAPDGDDLRAVARQLAAEGRWADLARRFGEEDFERILDDSFLAYRYGEALYHTGRMDLLATFAGRWEDRCGRRAEGRALLRALNLGAIAAFELGRIDEARARSERQVALAYAEGDVDMLARGTQNLAAIAGLEGRTEDAIASFQLAVPAYERLGHVRGLAQIRHNIGNCLRDLGRFEDAGDAYREAEELYRQADRLPGVAMAMGGRAEATVLAGDAEIGRRLADRAVTLARVCRDPISEAEALRVRSLARRREAGERGEPGAIADLVAALRLARRTGNVLLEAEVERDAARLRSARGQTGRAERALRRALRRFEKLGASGEASRIRELLAATS